MSVRHDWYQSETNVVISVLLKNAKDKNGSVKIEKERVEVSADNYELILALNREVDVAKSSYKLMSTKIEISLAKIEGVRWEALEKKEGEAAPKVFMAAAGSSDSGPPPHPSSKKNWDQMAKEIEEKEAKEMQVGGRDSGLRKRISLTCNPFISICRANRRCRPSSRRSTGTARTRCERR